MSFLNVYKLTLRDAMTGEVVDYREVPNFITYLGIGHMLDRATGKANVDGVSEGGSCWLALGTGSASINYWASGLNTEISGTGNLGRQKLDSVDRSSYTGIVSTTFGTDIGSGALTECGLFVKGYGSGNSLLEPGSALNTGILYNKVTFATLNKDSSNTLQVDLEVLNND